MVKYKDNIIFLSGKVDIRAGGPFGYIANLMKGLSGKKHNIAVIYDKRKSGLHFKFYSSFIKVISSLFIFKKQRKKIKKWLEDSFK